MAAHAGTFRTGAVRAGLRRWRLAGRPVIALLVLASLASAVLGGLLRAGAAWTFLTDNALVGRAAVSHAALMIPAFLGSVIGIERAVAVRARWAWMSPVAAGLSGLLIVADRLALAMLLGVAAAATSVAVHVLVLRRQRAAHTAVLLVAALAWFVGSALWALGQATAAALPWWFLFPVLTVAAERLEMTRLTRRPALAAPLLAGVVLALLLGAGMSSLNPLGGVLFGAALSMLALWLAVFDVARRTLFARGLARYMAVSLLAGYAWLALAGVAWLGTALGCPGRDLALHALGLGFIVSMVMGHAPVILPATARIKLLFGPWFYLPLAVLHATLMLRLWGGIGHPAWRTLGAEGNAAALLVFAGTLAGAAWMHRTRRPRSPLR